MDEFDPQRFTNDVLAALDSVTQQTRQIVVELAQHVIAQTNRAVEAEAKVAELTAKPAKK